MSRLSGPSKTWQLHGAKDFSWSLRFRTVKAWSQSIWSESLANAAHILPLLQYSLQQPGTSGCTGSYSLFSTHTYFYDDISLFIKAPRSPYQKAKLLPYSFVFLLLYPSKRLSSKVLLRKRKKKAPLDQDHCTVREAARTILPSVGRKIRYWLSSPQQNKGNEILLVLYAMLWDTPAQLLRGFREKGHKVGLG